jgi:elongation factor Ts
MTEAGRISAEMVKRLRDETGAGMMDCKRALQDADGDLDKAREVLREKGLAGHEKRKGRAANQGLVEAYIHGEGRVGVLVEVNSETDFVARTPEFKELAHEIALQIAAADPRWVSRDEVPEEIVAGERKVYEEQARSTGKPDTVIDRIVDGKLEAFYKQTVLVDQPYIRDPDRPIRDLVTEVAAKVGENVVIRRFARFQLGQEA